MAFEDEPQWAVVTQLRAVNDVTARDTHGEIPANEEVVVLVVARCEPRRVLVSDRQSNGLGEFFIQWLGRLALDHPGVTLSMRHEALVASHASATIPGRGRELRSDPELAAPASRAQQEP